MIKAAAEGSKYCLIVDDSRMIRKLARQITETMGYVVHEGENGREALACCKARMPDLILLDWDMPVMSGIEFVSALRGLDGGHKPKVVFCTSKSSAHDIHKGIEAGADEYILKPFAESALKVKLTAVVSGQH